MDWLMVAFSFEGRSRLTWENKWIPRNCFTWKNSFYEKQKLRGKVALKSENSKLWSTRVCHAIDSWKIIQSMLSNTTKDEKCNFIWNFPWIGSAIKRSLSEFSKFRVSSNDTWIWRFNFWMSQKSTHGKRLLEKTKRMLW